MLCKTNSDFPPLLLPSGFKLKSPDNSQSYVIFFHPADQNVKAEKNNTKCFSNVLLMSNLFNYCRNQMCLNLNFKSMSSKQKAGQTEHKQLNVLLDTLLHIKLLLTYVCCLILMSLYTRL